MSRPGEINKVDTTRSEPLGSFVSHAGYLLQLERRHSAHPPGQGAQPCHAREGMPRHFHPRFMKGAFLLAKTTLC